MDYIMLHTVAYDLLLLDVDCHCENCFKENAYLTKEHFFQQPLTTSHKDSQWVQQI